MNNSISISHFKTLIRAYYDEVKRGKGIVQHSFSTRKKIKPESLSRIKRRLEQGHLKVVE